MVAPEKNNELFIIQLSGYSLINTTKCTAVGYSMCWLYLRASFHVWWWNTLVTSHTTPTSDRAHCCIVYIGRARRTLVHLVVQRSGQLKNEAYFMMRSLGYIGSAWIITSALWYNLFSTKYHFIVPAVIPLLTSSSCLMAQCHVICPVASSMTVRQARTVCPCLSDLDYRNRPKWYLMHQGFASHNCQQGQINFSICICHSTLTSYIHEIHDLEARGLFVAWFAMRSLQEIRFSVLSATNGDNIFSAIEIRQHVAMEISWINRHFFLQ
jgi:hypothetical protein